MTPQVARVVAAADRAGCRPHRNGETADAFCPVCQGKTRSVKIAPGRSQAVVIACHHEPRCCTPDSILGAWGLSWADVCDETTPRRESRIVATYDYSDERGELLFQTVRLDPKDFRQRRPAGDGWTWKLGDVRRVLYRLPAVLATIESGGTVYVVEGEKDADAINAHDPDGRHVATCNPMGAGKWTSEYADMLAGAARVVVVADRDEPGRKHALDVAASLRGKVGSVGIVEARTGKDAADHLAAGHGLEEFVPLDVPAKAKVEAGLALAQSLAEIEDDAPRWSIDGMMQRGGLTLWWAAPGVGKSYLSLALVAWREARLFVHPDLTIRRPYQRVLWLAGEERAGRVRWRLRRVLRGMGRDADPEALAAIRHVWAIHPARPVTLDSVPALIDRERPEAVVIDPVTLLLPGDTGEKFDVDNAAVSRVCATIRSACVAADCDSLLIHHCRKAGDAYRGPIAWGASADVVVAFEAVGGAVRVEVEKCRDGARVPAFTVRVDHTADSARVVLAEQVAPGRLRPAEQMILAALRTAGPTAQHKLAAATALHKATVSKGCRALQAAGLVEQDGIANGSPVWVAVVDAAKGCR